MYHKLIFTLLVVVLSCFGVGASPVLDGDEGETVVIRDAILNGPAIPPKAPVAIPIECVFYPSSFTIIVDFLTNLGFVSVEIENQTTGEYSQTTVNAVAGPMAFPISGTSGDWSITFTLTDGTIYQGTFNI